MSPIRQQHRTYSMPVSAVRGCRSPYNDPRLLFPPHLCEDSDGCEPCPKGTYSNRFSDQWPLGCTFCPSTSYQDQEGASVVEQICLSSGSFPDRWARRHACHVQQIPSQFRRPFPWKTAAARRVTSHPFMMRAKHMASRVMLALRAIPKTSRSFAETSKFAGLQYSRLMGVCQLLNH